MPWPAPQFSRAAGLRGLLFSAALALALVAACRVELAEATAFRATDEFKPPCGLMTAPGANGWKRWSDWRTWGGPMRFLGVPGRGLRKWQDVTIPCGVSILLDVPDISVKTLTVKGWLKVLDSPSLPKIDVNAHFIVVMGRLTAGEPNRHFSSRLTFTLFPGSRKPYMLSKLAPADAANPRDLGHKAFIVVGGQVQFHGMPGGGDTPSWVRLSETANAGQRYVLVDADVSKWAAGMTVALASTSNDLNEAEHHQITSVAADISNPGVFRINLQTPLRHTHQGEVLPDGGTGTVGIFGEVALLDRHVSIQGTNEAAPHQLDGGHFIIYMTPTKQTLEGVQFKGLGNQGTLGKYPVHFHICGQDGQGHVVRKNAIVFTRQRCMVIHATGSMTIEDNIAYETKGHCYLLEEGSELNNNFRRNLGINARKVEKVIPPASSSKLDKQTDKQPTTFWLGTPHSNFIDNVAAGSEDSGFWLEATPYMRGVSRLLPAIGAINPLTYNWGEYTGNVAHSNVFGFRTYPHGSYARYPVYNTDPAPLEDFLIYRNTVGMFFFNSERIVVKSGIGWTSLAQRSNCFKSSRASRGRWPERSSSNGRMIGGCNCICPCLPARTTAGVDFTRPEEQLFQELKSKPGALARVKQQQRVGPMQRVIGDGKTGTDFTRPEEELFKELKSKPGALARVKQQQMAGPMQRVIGDGKTRGGEQDWNGFHSPRRVVIQRAQEQAGCTGQSEAAADGRADAAGDRSCGLHSARGATVSRAQEQAGRAGQSEAAAEGGADAAGYRGRQDRQLKTPLFFQPCLASLLLAGVDFTRPEEQLFQELKSKPGVDFTRPEEQLFQELKSKPGVDFTRPEEQLFQELKSKPGALARVKQQQMAGAMQRVIGDGKTGSFESPVGIVVSQCNPADPPGPNSIQNSFFSGYGATDDASYAVLLTANHAGGYWNSAFFVKGLTFGSGTNKFWATPNPTAGTPPRGGLVARFYAIRDLDGSLLGQSGFAVANYDPILPPPAVRAAKCSFKSTQNAYACTGVCYRSVGIGYHEWGVRPNGMAGLPAYVLRPYSYVVVTRLEDGAQFTDYGTDNDNPNSGPAVPNKKVRRYLTASLLAGYTYSLRIVPAPTNPLFYPQGIFVRSYDQEGCAGAVTVILEPKDANSQWVTSIPTIPCTGQNSSLAYQQYQCIDGQAKLAIRIGENSYGNHAIVNSTAAASQACTEDTPCSTTAATPSSTPQASPYSSDPLTPMSTSAQPLSPTRTTAGNIDPFYDPAFYAPS
ncbi:unnamed protein product [Closterium sp. Naga37s-1]|nr:unnamed protein product [Closterium sp. Naga37s-1]